MKKSNTVQFLVTCTYMEGFSLYGWQYTFQFMSQRFHNLLYCTSHRCATEECWTMLEVRMYTRLGMHMCTIHWKSAPVSITVVWFHVWQCWLLLGVLYRTDSLTILKSYKHKDRKEPNYTSKATMQSRHSLLPFQRIATHEMSTWHEFVLHYYLLLIDTPLVVLRCQCPNS